MLFPDEVPLLQEARKVQKAALIGNFVDRESERPALHPNDFQPLALISSTKEQSSRKESKVLRYADEYINLIVIAGKNIRTNTLFMCRLKYQRKKVATPW